MKSSTHTNSVTTMKFYWRTDTQSKLPTITSHKLSNGYIMSSLFVLFPHKCRSDSNVPSMITTSH